MPRRPTKEFIDHMQKKYQIPPGLAGYIWYHGKLSKKKKQYYEQIRKRRESKYQLNPGRMWHCQQYQYWWNRTKEAAQEYKKRPTEANLATWKYLAGITAAHKIASRMTRLAYEQPQKYWRLMTYSGRTGNKKGRPQKGEKRVMGGEIELEPGWKGGK